MWKVIKLAVLNWPGGLAGRNAGLLGVDGSGFLPLSMLIYFGALMCPSFGLPDSQKYEDSCLHHLARAAHWLFEGGTEAESCAVSLTTGQDRQKHI